MMPAVLSWLLTYAIHSTILLGAAALIARRLSDRHAWLDVIWKTALIGPLVTASLNLGPNVIPLATNASAIHQQTRDIALEPVAPLEPVAATTPVDTFMTPPVVPGSPRPASWRFVMPAWLSLVVMLWLLIAAVLLGRYGVRLIRLYRSLGTSQPVTTPGVLDILEALKASAGQPRAIRLTTSDLFAVPVAMAGRRIVVPPRFLEELDPDQQRAALAHELAHVIRRDSTWRIISATVERALFFQPLNRIARIRITEAAEFLSDQWAVQHTGSPLALARCLSAVASWASPMNDSCAVGVSAMARSDSAMVRRVTQILDERALSGSRPRVWWVVLALAVVAIAAPRVTATASAVVTPAAQRPASPSDIARAKANLRVQRPSAPNDSLDNRWRWALSEARRQGFSEFWIAYSFETPVHADDLVMTDSDGNSFVSSDGRIQGSGPPLMDVLGDGGGNLVVVLHYRGSGDDSFDRAFFRSAKLGFDFQRKPLFWLGFADESQSFTRVRALFERSRAEKLQRFLIELASMHGNSNMVIPFLTPLVGLSQPSAIRHEAAEGFGHHHDPRSVEILLRVARTDPLSEVRAEAAETIGEVQTPQAIPALSDLVDHSDDPAVRGEAAEGFADQPGPQALPVLERVIANSRYEEVLNEAVEALGELEGVNVLSALVQIVNTHPDRRAQTEAVETLGDIEDPGAIGALSRIAREHPDEQVVSEAIETITDLSAEALHPELLALAASGRTPRIRRDAVEAIADAVHETGNAQLLDRAEQALERALFDDPDTSVRMEALDAYGKLPRDRALRMYQRVIDKHPDSRVRREAVDQLRDLRQ